MVVGAGKQKGMTFIGLAMMLGVIAFFVLITLKLLPSYLEFFKITSILESMEQNPDLAKLGIPEVRNKINARFNIDAVEVITAKDIGLEKKGGLVIVTADYESRVHIMGNVDAVMVFKKEIEIVGN